MDDPNILKMIHELSPDAIETEASALLKRGMDACGPKHKERQQLAAMLGRILVWAWFKRFGGVRDQSSIDHLDEWSALTLHVQRIEDQVAPAYYPYRDQTVTKCKSCGMAIYFVTTENDKQMPVNFYSNVSHFIDCPHRDRHRQKGKAWACFKVPGLVPDDHNTYWPAYIITARSEDEAFAVASSYHKRYADTTLTPVSPGESGVSWIIPSDVEVMSWEDTELVYGLLAKGNVTAQQVAMRSAEVSRPIVWYITTLPVTAERNGTSMLSEIYAMYARMSDLA